MHQEMNIALDQLYRSPLLPRTEDDVEDLAKNIAENGLIQPLCVYKDKDKYAIYAGGRRYEALRLLKRSHAPCRVVEFTDNNSLKLQSLAENVCRKPLSTIQKCEAIHILYKTCDGNVEDFAKKLGFSKTVLKEYFTLRETLSPDILKKVDSGEVSIETAFTLNKVVKDTSQQATALEESKDAKEIKEWAKENIPKKKKGSTTKPWTWDENGNPISIPEDLFPKVLKLIRSFENST